MNVSSKKDKGRRLSQHIKAALHKKFPELEDGDIVVVSSGVPGRDLHLSPAAEADIPFDIEAKNQEALSVWKAFEQAERNTADGRVPLVVFKRNRSEVFAMLKLEDLLKIWK